MLVVREAVGTPALLASSEETLAQGRRPPNVLLVDSQPLFLTAVANLMRNSPLEAVVRVSTSSADAMELRGMHEVDLICCELQARPQDAVELLASFGLHPVPAIVILGDAGDERALIKCLAAGASAVFTKDAPVTELMSGMRLVLEGYRVVSSSVAQALLEFLRVQGPASDTHGLRRLSATETRVLVMIGSADSVGDIARSLNISQKTVRNHLASIYRKLHVGSRAEAVVLATRLGLVKPQ
jgi:DNA-binding NarL/FixJ family response regulator